MEEETKEKIHVLVRVRPLSKEEATTRSPWKLSSKSIASNKNCRPSIPPHTYTFDRVYGTKTPTLDIYNAHVKDLIATTMRGLNGTVIAYGQPRSGKTYTLRGSAEEAGILTLAVQDMFQIVQEASNGEFLIRISYLEIVEDELNDLLSTSRNHKLDLREDAEIGVAIAGLREEIVNKSEQAFSLLEFAEARRAADPGSHTLIRLVVESKNMDKKDDPFDTQDKDGYQISVLNFVEVAPAKAICGKNDTSSREEVQADKCLMTLESFMSKLCEGGATAGDSVPYNGSKLTHILRPSLGGNSRTSFICNISPAMMHMDETIEALDFALKITKVINCCKVNEVHTDKALLKRQKREIVKLCNRLKELSSIDLEEEILSRRNALLMIDVEKEQMSIELTGKTPSSSQGEYREQDQEEREDKQTIGGESGSDECIDVFSVDYNCSLEKRYSSGDYIGSFSALERLQELDSRISCRRHCFCPSAGTKRKRNFDVTAAADKFELPLQAKAARDVSCVRREDPADGHDPAEMQTLIVEETKDRQGLHERSCENCRNLQQKILKLETEKGLLEKRLHEQEAGHGKEVEALRCELSLEKLLRVESETAQKEVLEMNVSRASDASGTQQDSSQDKQKDREETAVKQNTETQSCTSQENEDQLKTPKEKESQTASTKKNLKVYQKGQGSQVRSELSSLRKGLAAAKESITALEDERDGLWKDLNQMKMRCKESQERQEINNTEEDSKDRHNIQQQETAVDTLKAEVESTASITDDLLAILLESFQMLTADLKSFQESVTEIKVLNGTTAELSETIELAKIQLSALRHGKLTSEKELNSMKSELAKLECVVERQSGVLKVLSDNDNLLNELASVRAAMKEAAGASELQISSIQQEYQTKLKETESECNDWKQKLSQLEETQTELQEKLSAAEAEVTRLTLALEDQSKRDKRPVKVVKARLMEAEAEIVRLNSQMKEKSISDQDGRKVQQELADSRAEVEKLRKEVEEKSKLEQERDQILTRLAETEAIIVNLTATSEEQKQVEIEQKNVLLKLESEIAKMTKSLEEKSEAGEQQKKLQSDFASLQEKIEKLTEEAQIKDVLEKTHREVLLRLDQSEQEVSKLAELLKATKEQSDLYLAEMLERSQNSEAEMVTMSQSLQREMEERQRLEEEHSKHLEVIRNLELESSGMDETNQTLKQVLDKKEEERQKDAEIITSLKAEVQKLTEIGGEWENEKRLRIDVVDKLEAKLTELACSIGEEEERRKKLEKELIETRDKNTNLDGDLRKLTEILQTSIHENDDFKKGNKKDLEVITSLEAKIQSITESLQQCIKEKESLSERLTLALEEAGAATTTASKLTEELKSRKEEKRTLEENLRKKLDDYSDLESRHSLLVEQLNEKLEERNKLESKAEEVASKLAVAQEDVENMTMSLTRVKEEKSLLEKSNKELLETCSALKLEMAKLSESTTKEIEFPEKLNRKSSGASKGRSKAPKMVGHMEKERKTKDQDDSVNKAVNLSDEMETANVSRQATPTLEEKSRLEEELQNMQLRLSSSETEIVRLKEELTEKGTLEVELSDTQHKLGEVTKEVKRLLDEKRNLEEEQRKLLDRSTSPGAEVPNSSGSEDFQLVRAELNESKAELAIVRTALTEKLCLEETLIKTQIELVEKQGECQRLTKQLRVNRKQKKLLQKLSSTQMEVSRLKTTMLGRLEDHADNIKNVQVSELSGQATLQKETEKDIVELREKLTNAETEVRSLTGLVQEKEKLLEDHARVQSQLAIAKTEVERLANTLAESSRLKKDKEKRWKEQEEKLRSKVAALEEKVRCIEEERKSQNFIKCAECEVLQTMVEQLRKERNELREQYTATHARIKTLQAELDNHKKEFESIERSWKTKSQKNEKELSEFRLKASKMEEGTARIAQEKRGLEERLNCSESQVATLRESARTASKELEMARHKLNLLQSQHQSHMAAFCGELNKKNARTVELEQELKTLLSQPPPPLPPQPPPPLPPAPVIPNEYANYVTTPYRPQAWSFPPLQPPQQPNTQPHWGGVPYKGPQR
ncbi:hypothetical protein R1sor_003900 [Riccia sorocarpa]|uniref:Kinesin motor domain-containing protein n=1 Tax=Riccia sorocarpa TaxID=122646 RepID=A0ABD3H300_9MARC